MCTHFIWSRYIDSRRYQLIYDADRIPALSILADKCQEKLEFLCAPNPNPNYNFQYNSLNEVSESLTAAEHLANLGRKYSASSSYESFCNSLALQDISHGSLLSINRFIYTTSYDFLFKTFDWTIADATQSLRRLKEWFDQSGYAVEYVMVIRNVADWIQAQALLYGEAGPPLILRRLRDLPILLRSCQSLNIPIFSMDHVIKTIKLGQLEFWQDLSPLNSIHIQSMLDQAKASITAIERGNVGAIKAGKNKRLYRLIQYLSEKNPILRTSLVRSLSSSHLKILENFPAIQQQIQQDYEGVLLNNAKLKV